MDALAATEALVADWAATVDDPDDGPPFWIALALTQWQLGRLDDRVKARALDAIDSGAGMLRWDEAGPAQARARRAVLAKTRAAIISPMGAPKKLKRPRPH